MTPMHVVIPFASALSEPARLALSTLQLPHLERLLARAEALPADPAPAAGEAPDEYSLSMPHERVEAALRGWPVIDGRLPFGAALARADGLLPEAAPAGHGWALLTPAHWQVGSEGVTLIDPSSLSLTDDESRALHEAVRPLFEDLGWTFAFGDALRWYAAHPSLDDAPTASLDRAIGRGVDLWMNDHPALRTVRRLQSEVQMTLYTHPVNDAREARGLQAVNSFWLSGTGPAGVAPAPLPDDVVVDDRLRAFALSEDWAGWAEAWAALDAGPVRQVLEAIEGAAGPGAAPASLTLCGERTARRLVPARRPWWRAVFSPAARPAAPVLEAL